MATLYDVTVSAINQHLKRIFSDRELSEGAVVKRYLTTAADGKSYNVKHYSLQAIIAVGFKIRVVQDRLFESDFDRMLNKAQRLGEGAEPSKETRDRRP